VRETGSPKTTLNKTKGDIGKRREIEKERKRAERIKRSLPGLNQKLVADTGMAEQSQLYRQFSRALMVGNWRSPKKSLKTAKKKRAYVVKEGVDGSQ